MMKNDDLLLLIKFKIIVVFLVILLPSREAIAQFANGADIGWLSQMEDSGYVFKDNSGIQKNCLDILKEKGINSLRLRVWVNPKNRWCSKKDVIYMAHRADSMDFNVMIDFHMSDTWADPGHQTKPAAWINDSFPQLLTDVYNHVYGVLDTMKSLGIIPRWIQIGNETDDGMLWPDGRASIHMDNFAALIKSGYDAVKAIDSTIQVIVHLSNGHDDAMYRWMFDGLKNNGAKWDIVGMSVYPYWANLPWAIDDSLALITMKDVITRYNTKVMVCEAGYLYDKPVDANHYLLDLIEKTKSVGGLGVFYWEPECYHWQDYQLGAWDPITKQPTVAMDAFLGIYATSVSQENIFKNYELKIYPNPFNPNAMIEYTIPESSNISIKIYSVLGKEVATLIEEYKDAGQYKVIWPADNISSGVYFCRMKSGNYFEIKKIVLLR